MEIPEWLKPGLMGAAAGAVALAIIGFSWGGWVTGSSANDMAEDRSEDAVLMALTPFCVENSVQDPNFEQVIAEMKAARAYQRSDSIAKAGWATMPGDSEPNLQLARACVKEFEARL